MTVRFLEALTYGVCVLLLLIVWMLLDAAGPFIFGA